MDRTNPLLIECVEQASRRDLVPEACLAVLVVLLLVICIAWADVRALVKFTGGIK